MRFLGLCEVIQLLQSVRVIQMAYCSLRGVAHKFNRFLICLYQITASLNFSHWRCMDLSRKFKLACDCNKGVEVLRIELRVAYIPIKLDIHLAWFLLVISYPSSSCTKKAARFLVRNAQTNGPLFSYTGSRLHY